MSMLVVVLLVAVVIICAIVAQSRSRSLDDQRYGSGLDRLTNEELGRLAVKTKAELRLKKAQDEHRRTLVTEVRLAKAALDGACPSCGHHWCSCTYYGS